MWLQNQFFQTQSSCPLQSWMVWCTYVNFPNSKKWNTYICLISLLWVPFGLLPAGSGVWLSEEQVEHFLSMLPCNKNIFFKDFLLTWCFYWNFVASSTFPCSTNSNWPYQRQILGSESWRIREAGRPATRGPFTSTNAQTKGTIMSSNCLLKLHPQTAQERDAVE